VQTANKTQSRLYHLHIIIVTAFIIGVASSHKLWVGTSRSFPPISLIDGLSITGPLTDYLAPLLLIVALASSIISKRPRLFLIAAIVLILLLATLDQNRLQPWVYQYVLILSALSCYSGQSLDQMSAGGCLATNQLIIAALYFWGGIQKLNWAFSHEVIPSLLEPYVGRLPHLTTIGTGLAICEALIGIGLLIQRTRPIAVVSAIGMHSLILIFLISSNQNSVVWPWNISMMIMLPLLFWRTRTDVWQTLLSMNKGDITSHFAKVVFLVCGVLPALSFIGLWDMYLSAALYSGNTPVAVVHLSDQVRNRLPLPAQSQVFTTKRGELMVPLYEWSMAELNVPPYPESRVYRRLTRHLCRYAEDPREVELILKEKPAIFSGKYAVNKIDCSNLIPFTE
jgi:hypothetical protein